MGGGIINKTIWLNKKPSVLWHLVYVTVYLVASETLPSNADSTRRYVCFAFRSLTVTVIS